MPPAYQLKVPLLFGPPRRRPRSSLEQSRFHLLFEAIAAPADIDGDGVVQQAVERALDDDLGGAVDVRGRLIEDQDAGIGEQRSRDRADRRPTRYVFASGWRMRFDRCLTCRGAAMLHCARLC